VIGAMCLLLKQYSSICFIISYLYLIFIIVHPIMSWKSSV